MTEEACSERMEFRGTHPAVALTAVSRKQHSISYKSDVYLIGKEAAKTLSRSAYFSSAFN